MLHLQIVVVYIRTMSIGNEKQCCSFKRGLKAVEGSSVHTHRQQPCVRTHAKTGVPQSPKWKHSFSPYHVGDLFFSWCKAFSWCPRPMIPTQQFSGRTKLLPLVWGYSLLLTGSQSTSRGTQWRCGSALGRQGTQKCTLWFQYVIFSICMPVSP